MADEGGDNISNWKLYLIMAFMLIFGTANTLVQKTQDSTELPGKVAYDDAKPDEKRKYTHPYFQCATMFTGELLCLFAYGIKRFLLKKKQVEFDRESVSNPDMIAPSSPGAQLAAQVKLKTNINPLWFALPALFDCTASSLMFAALTEVAASVYQMMRGFIVVITALFSVIFLKKKQYFHHIVAITMILSGVVLVGYSGISSSESGHEESGGGTSVRGIVLLIVAQCFVGGLFIVEEKLFDGYYIDPLMVVGFEGLFGLCYWIILLPIFQKIDCTHRGVCGDNGKIEDTTLAFQQNADNSAILIMSLGIILSIAGFNVCGVSITKYASAAQRSTIDTSRTLLIWLWEMLISKKEKFLVGEMFAFILLVIGTLIYNEILIVPIDIFRRNTRKAIAERENGMDDGGDQKNYMTTSPTAKYDQNRNLRNIEKAYNERDNLIEQHQQNMLYDDNNDFVANPSQQPSENSSNHDSNKKPWQR